MKKHARAVRRLSYLAVAKVPGERAHSIQIAKTCEALARRLDELELVVPCLGQRRPDRSFLQKIRLVRPATPNFLPLGRWAPGWLMRMLFNVQSTIFALVALARALVVGRFDVYYTRNPYVGLAFAIAFGRRTVIELHMPATSVGRRALLRLCRLFRCRFVAISDALRRQTADCLRVRPDEIGVAHDGFDPAHFQQQVTRAEERRTLGITDKAFVICYVGSAATLGAAKGVRFIVEAFRRAALSEALLLLVGIRPNEVVPHAEDVRCLGRIPQKNVAAVLKACDGAVVSFPEAPAYAHAMSPLKLFEYVAAGLPILAPDLPNLREVLDESCALFARLGDVKALADNMRRLWSDAELRSRLGAASAERAPRYTWDARAERLLRFLQPGSAG